mmetsp:Transcript_45383/g.142764  ORF Transcript_45383/g.142764 Transcript_45383/m.142764 type:complete len:514 (+) Transcript_45383:677-2218(+)
MVERSLRVRAQVRVGLHQLGDEGDELRVVAPVCGEDHRDRGLARPHAAEPPFLLADEPVAQLRGVGLVGEIVVRERALPEQRARQRAKHGDVRGEERLDGAVVEEQLARVELHQDAAEGPEVDLRRVGEAEDDLRCPIGAALHVRAALVVVQVRVAIVDHLDLARGQRRDENVFRLEVAVDDVALVQALQRVQALLGDVAQPFDREVARQPALLDVLVDVVQVVAQQLVHNEQRLAKVKHIQQQRQPLRLLRRHLRGEKLEKLHLPQVLVEDILGVLRNLDADEPVPPRRSQILTLHRVAKRAAAEVLDHHIPAGDDLLLLDAEVRLRLEAGGEAVVVHHHGKVVQLARLALALVPLAMEDRVRLGEQHVRHLLRRERLHVVQLPRPRRRACEGERARESESIRGEATTAPLPGRCNAPGTGSASAVGATLCALDDPTPADASPPPRASGGASAAALAISSAKLVSVRDMPRFSSHLVTTAAAASVGSPSSSEHSASAGSPSAIRGLRATVQQ